MGWPKSPGAALGRAPLGSHQAGTLVVGELTDPTLVAGIAGKPGAEEQHDEPLRQLGVIKSRRQRDEVRVVVLATEPGAVLAPGDDATGAVYLVRGHRLPVSRAPDDHSQTPRVRNDGQRGRQAETGVVVVGVEGCRAVIHRVVTGRRE